MKFFSIIFLIFQLIFIVETMVKNNLDSQPGKKSSICSSFRILTNFSVQNECISDVNRIRRSNNVFRAVVALSISIRSTKNAFFLPMTVKFIRRNKWKELVPVESLEWSNKCQIWTLRNRTWNRRRASDLLLSIHRRKQKFYELFFSFTKNKILPFAYLRIIIHWDVATTVKTTNGLRSVWIQSVRMRHVSKLLLTALMTFVFVKLNVILITFA